jgi:hypothetical protein
MEIGSAMPIIMSIVLRVALLYLFFWYLLDFDFELGLPYLRFVIAVGIAALFVIGLIVWKTFNAWPGFDLDKDHPTTSLLPFVLLNLVPVAAVGVATWYAHYFGWGLLQFTQHALKRISSIW